MGINLEKFEQEYQSKDAQLVDLTKKTAISLEKHNLSGNVAKVAVCLDISYSMTSLYKSGAVSELVKKLIPLGLSFDDDGEIDVFTFGQNGHQKEAINLNNYVSRLDAMKQEPLEGRTNYAKAIRLVEDFYSKQSDAANVPVFVVFVTDGDATDKAEATAAMKSISKLPIFFQFVALGADYNPNADAPAPAPEKKTGLLGKLFGGNNAAPAPNQPPRQFGFLAQLDEMDGRTVDNAGFFAVKTPDSASPDALYDMLMGEYPSFLADARAARVLR